MLSVFASLFGIPVGITSSAVRLKICTTTAEFKKFKSIIKKKKKKHYQVIWLVKTILSNIEVLISRAFINSCISLDEFVSVNNVLKECHEMKEEIKNLKT